MLFINFFSTYLSFENKGGTQALSFILIVLMSLKKKSSDDGYTEYYKQLHHKLGTKQ